MAKPLLYILDSSIDITGAFICARNEAKILQKDFDVVLVLPSSSKISEDELALFKKVVKLPIINLRKSVISLLLYFPALIISSIKLAHEMKKDACLTHQVNDYYLMNGIVLRLLGYKGKIATWVRIDPESYGSFFSKYWLKFDYWASDNIVAVSNFIFSRLPLSSKNRLVYDAVIERSVGNQKIDQNKKKLIYIGNYIEGKGQQYAIETFDLIAGDFSEIELHFYGSDMGLGKNKHFKQKLQQRAKKSPYANRIVFHGFTKDPQKVLEEGYMALNFSESESFSMTCLEASFAGLSIVATRSGGPEEIIVDNETGYLVDRGDVKQMADVIRDLLNDTHKNRQFGENGVCYVGKKFSAEVFRKSILTLLGEAK
jgi:glycosyltransferase involved in cell wall biosynthesis